MQNILDRAFTKTPQIPPHHFCSQKIRWLKAPEQIESISLTYNTLQYSQPSYLRQLFAIQSSRSTHSSSALTLFRHSITSSLKFALSSIAIAGPPLWSKLPPALQQISDPFYELTKTSPLVISLQLFHSKLKALLFSKSYPDSSPSPYLPPVSTPNTIHHSRLIVCLPNSLDSYPLPIDLFCFG